MKKNKDTFIKLDPKDIRFISLEGCKVFGERTDIVFKEIKKIKTHLFRRSETIIINKELFVKNDETGEWKEAIWYPYFKEKNIYAVVLRHDSSSLGFFEITEDDKVLDVNVLTVEYFDSVRSMYFFRQSEKELWDKAVKKVTEFLNTNKITWIEM